MLQMFVENSEFQLRIYIKSRFHVKFMQDIPHQTNLASFLFAEN